MNRNELEKITTDYRQEMASYLEQIISIIKDRKLSSKEVESFELNNSSVEVNQAEHAEQFFSHNCALLLTKAYFHLLAVHHANHTSNLHSVAIHTRVVLECAGQIAETANNYEDPKRNGLENWPTSILLCVITCLFIKKK